MKFIFTLFELSNNAPPFDVVVEADIGYITLETIVSAYPSKDFHIDKWCALMEAEEDVVL